jgi:hypothetical protein
MGVLKNPFVLYLCLFSVILVMPDVLTYRYYVFGLGVCVVFLCFEGEDCFSCCFVRSLPVFLGLSFRAVLRPFVLRSHVAVWKWVQKAIHLQV